MTNPPIFLHRVEVDGRLVDVAVDGGRITAVAPDLPPQRAALVIDGHGGALLPGLHDHHLHLLATAAAAESVVIGPPDVRDEASFTVALQRADATLPAGRWLRAVAYHERVAGDLDRHALDAVVPERPVRLQHRTGARWTLNSAAIDALDLAARAHPGIERDPSGRPTGRLHRADRWLRDLLPREGEPIDEPSTTTASSSDLLPPQGPPSPRNSLKVGPDLAALSARLARYGVTAVTDTTPTDRIDDLVAIAEAAASGALPQRVVVTGGPELSGASMPAGVERGPVKLVIDDGAYPDLEVLAAQVEDAHGHGRAVAVHCVTRTSLVLALAAWDAAGSAPGDRVEHGAVIPTELIDGLARHGLTVVTQPGFVGERGDEYLAEVDADDLPHLYRCRSLLDAGVRVAASTDAPYTALDPWQAMRAAVARTAPSGAVLGAGEAVGPAQALALFLSDVGDPGGPPRTVHVGGPADLCLLRVPLAAALDRLRAEDVGATVIGGRIVE